MATYETVIFGEKVAISANFSQAADTIFRRTDEGEWESTQYQVADFRHSSEEAMRREIEEIIVAGGDDPEDFGDEIEAALENMEIVDEE